MARKPKSPADPHGSTPASGSDRHLSERTRKAPEALTMDGQNFPGTPTWAPATSLYELVNPNRPRPKQMPKTKKTSK